MKLTITQLVVIIISLLSLFIVLGLAYFTNTAMNQSADQECAASVQIRATAVRMDSIIDGRFPPLVGCDTRFRDFSEERNARVAAQIQADFYWCELSFSGRDILGNARSETFCHVCALYANNDPREIPQMASRIPRFTQDEQAIRLPGEDESHDDFEFFLEESVAIIHIQDKTVDHSFMSNLLRSSTDSAVAGAVTGYASGTVRLVLGRSMQIARVFPKARVAVTVLSVAGYVGAIVYRPDTNSLSTTIIRPYSEQELLDAGCTIVRPQ